MIGKAFEFNGQTISKATVDYKIGLTIVQWKTLDVSDEQQNVQGYHGIKLSPTFARGRRIALEGLIMADDHIKSSKAIDYLESLFALQGTPSQTDFLPFIVTDEQDRRRVVNVKIKEPVSIDIDDDDYIAGTTRRWRVVLQAEDSRYFGVDEQSVIGSEGYFGGVMLPVKLACQLDKYFNQIQVIANGNIDSPIKLIITALNNIDSPLMIRNITDGSFFGLDMSAVAGDIIVIDSKTKTATKNGSNILAQRIEGSIWPKAKNTSIFSIYDQDGGLYTSDFDVNIAFRDVLL